MFAFHSHVITNIHTENNYCDSGDFYLANYTYSYNDGDHFTGGRVEVCYNGTYYPVCAEGWTDSDAAVVCKHYGYHYPYYRE